MSKSINLWYREGTSDKIYDVWLRPGGEGWLVDFSYGRRGATPTSGTKTQQPVSYGEAERIYDKLVAEKMAKGYKPTGDNPTPVTSVSDKVSTGLIPQLLNPIDLSDLEKYLVDDAYLLEAKLDGKRILAKIQNLNVTTSNRNGFECGVPQEIINRLAELPNCVLDGELIGTTYHVFDILELIGENLRNTDCISRFRTLTQIVKESDCVKIVRCATDEVSKRSLTAALKDEEGVVLKLKSSKYVSGRPHSLGSQLKCKFWNSCTAKVIGVNNKRSVSLGLANGSGVTNVGNVTIPQNYEIPQVDCLVEIKYLYGRIGGSLYQPQYLGIREDCEIDNLACVRIKADDTTGAAEDN